MKLKVGSAFSGIGAWEKALKRSNIDYELEWFFEKDKYASTAYCAIHNVSKDLNKGDISKANVGDLEDIDVFVYSPPCQAFSVAGKRLGIKDPRGTLFYYALPIIESKKPKYALMENVKGLTTKGMKDLFKDMLNELESLGYNNYYKVLNSKNYGVPQNRERVYIISIRKDIDKGTFSFPEPFDNGIRLKDLLEDEVEEKYYINNEKTEKLLKELKEKNLLLGDRFGADSTINDPQRRDISNYITARYDARIQNQKQIGMVVAEPNNLCMPCITPDRINKRQNGRRFKEDGDPMFTLTAQDRHGVLVESKPKRLGGMYDTEKSKHQAGSVWDKEEIAPTIDTMQGGHREPLIIENTNNLKFMGGLGEKDWAKDGKKLSRNYPQGERVYDSEGIACSQTSNGGGIGGPTGLYLIKYKIRKLTPLECWRLMDFDDEDYWIARRALEETYYNGKDRSNSQMYKMAGNSITVGVLEEIFKNLF